MNKYKNISDKDLALPNIGIVKAGKVIESEIEINNVNFELIKEDKKEDQKTEVEKPLQENKTDK